MSNGLTQDERAHMLEQIKREEERADECLAEAVIYRKLLEACYKAASEAVENNDLSRLYSERNLHLFKLPNDSKVKEWGRDFLHACRRNSAWLRTASESLEKIQDAGEKLIVEEGTENSELKKQILDAAREGLIPHV